MFGGMLVNIEQLASGGSGCKSRVAFTNFYGINTCNIIHFRLLNLKSKEM